MERKLNLKEYRSDTKPVNISNNTLQRFALAAGLTLSDKRAIEEVEQVPMSKTGLRIHETTFSKFDLQNTWISLLKLRYHQFEDLDWESQAFRSRVVNYEMLRGLEYL